MHSDQNKHKVYTMDMGIYALSIMLERIRTYIDKRAFIRGRTLFYSIKEPGKRWRKQQMELPAATQIVHDLYGEGACQQLTH